MLLRKDDPWPKGLSVPDVRSWRVVDDGGDTVGFVQSLAVDPRQKVVEAVLIGPSDRYSSDEFRVEDGVVRLTHRLERRTGGATAVQSAADGFEEAFREHHKHVYDGDEGGFERLKSAYAFGRAAARDADYARRSFDRAEEDLRARYVSHGLVPSYETAREAVRFGYALSQSRGTDPASGPAAGMEKDSRQMLNADKVASEEAVRSGSSMETGEPPEDDGSVLGA